MTNFQKFGVWKLVFGYYLGFGIWSLEFETPLTLVPIKIYLEG